MKTEMKTQLNYNDCLKIVQGLNALDNIWTKNNMIDEFDKFTINWLQETFITCTQAIKKHRTIELKIIKK